ncbi:hypothetical protein AMJ74_05065 [candidate division WOR_3 bacterium SM1_77]|uniref:UPF0235 protein AMJ74_05065 n=1 Tax=candidate division WOR_3 bacterium SM1_77 TaxID=1703778 RepID=A0A0S8JWH2_UNCW3|nr:MAG: hypothetical protein AMJ74_05065 [candidate division WOR_3 bacterium SM1_77]
MLLKVHVIPKSKRIEIEELDEKNLRVRLSSPPIDGRANSELIELLARYYKKGKSSIRIRKGFRSRNKLIEVTD